MAEPLTPNEAQTPNDTTDDKDTGTPWPTDDQAVLKLVQDRRKKAEAHLSDWYDDAVMDFQFREGRQWSEEDADKMENEERIAATFNRVGPIINAILGQEVCNRQEVRYLPRRVNMQPPPAQPGQPPAPPQPQAADPMNDAVKWARDTCNAEDEDSDAFADMVTCGVGWTCTDMDYDTDPDGMIRTRRKDPVLVRWDTSARQKNLADKKWVQCDYWMSPEDIEDEWPEADLDGSTNLSAPVERMKPHDASDAWKYTNNAAGKDRYNDELRVIHHVQVFRKDMVRVIDPATQQMREYDKAQFAQMAKAHKQMSAQDPTMPPMPDPLPVKKQVYWEAWTVGDVVLESGEAPAQDGFCYEAMTCYRERETGYWYGVTRMMRDPQRYANRLMSLMMSILATGAKGGFLYETGALVNPKKAKGDWAKHNSAIELNPGGLEKIQPKPPQNMPPGASDLMQFAIASIRDVTGVNVDMLGGAERDQPGVVEDMRTKAGLTILAGVFDAIRLYRKRSAVLWAEYVRRFISDGRLIRVLGPQGEQFVPLMRQEDGLKYDIVVDESPAARDVKEKTWEALQVIVPQAAQMGMPVPAEMLDYAPIPQSLALSWKQQIAAKAAQPPQPPIQIQLEQMKQQGAQQQAMVKAQADQATTQAKSAADAQVAQVKTQADATIAHMQASFKAQTDENRNQLEAQRSLLETRYQIQLEAFKQSAQQQTAIAIAHINAAAKIAAAEASGVKADQQAALAREQSGER